MPHWLQWLKWLSFITHAYSGVSNTGFVQQCTLFIIMALTRACCFLSPAALKLQFPTNTVVDGIPVRSSPRLTTVDWQARLAWITCLQLSVALRRVCVFHRSSLQDLMLGCCSPSFLRFELAPI